jgi:NADH-ubiquinone oxidoreductase chain 2
MILSSALDSGYVFMAFVAVLTSVISAYYYLAVVKQMFFHDTNYKINSSLENITISNIIKYRTNYNVLEETTININNIHLSSGLTITISLLTLTILLFMIIPDE